MLTIFFGTPPPITVDVTSNLDIGTFFRITDIGSAVGNILGLTLLLGSLTFVLYFAWSALSWLTAGGDKSKVESARQRMTNAFIGLVLLAASWAIYLIVIYILGLPILTPSPPPPGICDCINWVPQPGDTCVLPDIPQCPVQDGCVCAP